MKAGIVFLLLAAACAGRDYPLEKREAFTHTFSGATVLDVNNVNGFIHVAGDSGTTIRVEGEKIMRALDAEEMARAKREVTMDMNQKDGVAQLYENGPFRDHDHGSDYHGFHEDDRRHYEVTYNLTIHVPHVIGLKLKSVNGAIECADTSGKFDIHAVNGHIRIARIAGSGEVQTVNGAQDITFAESPKADSEFHSVNGKLDLTFPAGLSADVRVQTMNGAAYTDFDATALASAPDAQSDVVRGAHRWRHQFATLRIGGGGPLLTFQTVNGSIHIRKAQ